MLVSFVRMFSRSKLIDELLYFCHQGGFIEVFKPRGLSSHQLRDEDYARGETALDADAPRTQQYDYENPTFDKI